MKTKEKYDKNNKDHQDSTKYEVIEWEISSDNRHPIGVECGDILSDAQRR